MQLSATAITALLLAAGVGSFTETAPASTIGHASASAMPVSTPQPLQDKAGNGLVRQAIAA
ncbi:MAG: hypothetical protein ACOH2M_12375 [Cypionkella sp.]